MKYKHLVVGGTFDNFHMGHQKLIDHAFALSERVSIGVAKTPLYRHKFLSSLIEEYRLRKNNVVSYLKDKKWLSRAKIIAINNIYGNTKRNKNIQAILVSQTTYRNAQKINQWRTDHGLDPLKIEMILFVYDNCGQVISSERIRSGEIDREGKSYLKIFNKTLILPQNLRIDLRKPIGEVIDEQGNESKTAKKIIQLIKRLTPTMVITVGDAVTGSLLQEGFDPDVRIVDYKIRRKKITDESAKILSRVNSSSKSIINNPGTISQEAVFEFKKTIEKYFKTKEKQLLVIDGEEDLLAMPAMLLAPLNSLVLYGQWNLGVVVVKINEEIKNRVKNLISGFSQ